LPSVDVGLGARARLVLDDDHLSSLCASGDSASQNILLSDEFLSLNLNLDRLDLSILNSLRKSSPFDSFESNLISVNLSTTCFDLDIELCLNRESVNNGWLDCMSVLEGASFSFANISVSVGTSNSGYCTSGSVASGNSYLASVSSGDSSLASVSSASSDSVASGDSSLASVSSASSDSVASGDSSLASVASASSDSVASGNSCLASVSSGDSSLASVSSASSACRDSHSSRTIDSSRCCSYAVSLSVGSGI